MVLEIAKAQGRVEDERWHVRKDGSRFFASGVLTSILDRNGKVIASSPRAPARTQEDSAATHIREALAGRPSLSDVIPAAAPGKPNVLEWALPFKTPFGRRIEVEALNATLISGFLTSYLGKSQTDTHAVAFVLDSRNRVVGAAGGVAQLGKLPKEPALLGALAQRSHGKYHDGGATRYFASAPVQGSTWKVVSSVPTNNLYGPLSGSKRWFLFLILGAFALAGGASLVFFRRALVNGMKLAKANRELTLVNTTLEERVAERTAEVEERAKELARSNEELEQFSSVASHDLQEPLRKIRMFGDRLRERLRGPPNPLQAALLASRHSTGVPMVPVTHAITPWHKTGSAGQRVALSVRA